MNAPTPGEGANQRLTPGAQRILDVASELFYNRGINVVGVDTIAAESGVTKRTLYDRFGSKDNLIATYLATRDRRWRELVTTRLKAAPADPLSRALVPFDVLDEWLVPDSRGCSFVNAFAELPDPQHPARRIAVAEKQWLHDLFRDQLAEAGATNPATLATALLALHEGAIVTHSIADDPSATATARDGAETLIRHSTDVAVTTSSCSVHQHYPPDAKEAISQYDPR